MPSSRRGVSTPMAWPRWRDSSGQARWSTEPTSSSNGSGPLGPMTSGPTCESLPDSRRPSASESRWPTSRGPNDHSSTSTRWRAHPGPGTLLPPSSCPCRIRSRSSGWPTRRGQSWWSGMPWASWQRPAKGCWSRVDPSCSARRSARIPPRSGSSTWREPGWYSPTPTGRTATAGAPSARRPGTRSDSTRHRPPATSPTSASPCYRSMPAPGRSPDRLASAWMPPPTATP